jgi:hypothetical protein
MACDDLPPLRSEEEKGVAFYGRFLNPLLAGFLLTAGEGSLACSAFALGFLSFFLCMFCLLVRDLDAVVILLHGQLLYLQYQCPLCSFCTVCFILLEELC